LDFKDELRPLISLEAAKWIKYLRVDEEYSFRGIAEECAIKWDKGWGTNQILGEDLCAVAIEVLGDDPQKDGWL
jgi:hypothetical protein|tara:strand:+ start:115 stop:336 length:222 start_codon:yes stop_codon:yes gene_type:complete